MAKNDNIGKMNPQHGSSAGSQHKPGGSHQESGSHGITGGTQQGDSQHGATSGSSSTSSGVMEQAADTMNRIKDKGQEALEGARESVSALPGKATDAVACQMKQAADQLRERLPQEGTIGSAAHTVADGLESGATYLQEHDFRDMAEDLAGVVRSYPIPAVLAGIGIGFLLGRTLRS